MSPFKLLLTDAARAATISLHMIGPKESRLLTEIADTCAPSLNEPDPDVLASMIKLGAVRMQKSDIDDGSFPMLTDLGKAIWQICALQPH